MFKRIRTQSYSPLNLGYFPVNPILVSFIFIICAYFLPRRPSPSPSLPQGFNTCLFCYGQTGTGKTTTIMGSAGGPWESLQWTGWANGLFFMSFVLMCFFLSVFDFFSFVFGTWWICLGSVEAFGLPEYIPVGMKIKSKSHLGLHTSYQ